MTVLTDPAECGPVTLALCQDTQAEAYDYPESFFAEKIWTQRRIRPDADELAKRPPSSAMRRSPSSSRAAACSIRAPNRRSRISPRGTASPVGETQAGKSSLAHDHPACLGSVGVTGTGAANALAEEADVVIAVGTRLQDFTTGSWALFKDPNRRIVGLNVQGFDATKHNAQPLVADARVGLEELSQALAGLESARGLDRKSPGREGALVRSVRALHRSDQCGASVRRAGDRRGAAHLLAVRRGGLRRGRLAGRAAQALEGQHGPRLPHGIRLFLHGLRDRRRARREDGRSEPRGHRDGGRRLLPDDEFRARHLGDAGAEAHRRAARQPRAMAASTACSARPAARASTTCCSTPTM